MIYYLLVVRILIGVDTTILLIVVIVNMIIEMKMTIKKYLSEVGFEPTPTYVDQNTPVTERVVLLSLAP